MRRVFTLLFALAALGHTGCHGRVSAFFYRLTHCNDCCPSYGHGGYASSVGVAAPVYGYGAPAAPCCSTPAAPIYNAAPVSYSPNPVSTPIFNGTPTPLPGPNVYPTPSTTAPIPEKK